ncbi:MAG: hypothetical protein LBG59_00650 [Candidatus Peribacteria bacterium]|jgi:hypothetical protein|nr:hypothetical protein [Candidatus Peribacteria bacterium]
MTLNSNQESQPAVEYRAVCRNLPANAHWTSNGETRKEIPQTESSPNVREPSPVGTYDASTDNDKCNFVCDEGYKREDVTCRVTVGVFHNITKGTIIVTDDTTTYTIMDKNLGASVAGTGKDSYGSYFQRGNNYGFASTGTISHSSGLVPNALAYGPSPLSYYSGSTFIRSVTSSNHSDYWTGGQNDNLR